MVRPGVYRPWFFAFFSLRFSFSDFCGAFFASFFGFSDPFIAASCGLGVRAQANRRSPGPSTPTKFVPVVTNTAMITERCARRTLLATADRRDSKESSLSRQLLSSGGPGRQV